MTSAFLHKFPDVEDMSMNLMELFNFYGNYFDPKRTIITNENYPYFVPSDVGMLDEHIVIVDPLNSLNNTAKGAFKIAQIKEIFKEAHSFLTQCLD
jgi:hypothetical protein